MAWSDRLAELGITLPAVPAPAGAYVPAIRSGALVFTAGQVPFVNGVVAATGKVGGEVGPDEAKGHARTCALNALAAVDALVGIDAVVRVVKVTGFVASAEGFTGQTGVLNGATELLGEIFGDAGKHARAAVGVNTLPRDASVEIEVLFEAR